MHLKESNSACSWSNHECACSWRNDERVYSWRNVEWAYSWKNLDDVILKDLLFKEPLWSMFMMGILMEHALEGNWQLSMMSSPIFLTFSMPILHTMWAGKKHIFTSFCRLCNWPVCEGMNCIWKSLSFSEKMDLRSGQKTNPT